jgi:hypothetical protein
MRRSPRASICLPCCVVLLLSCDDTPTERPTDAAVVVDVGGVPEASTGADAGRDAAGPGSESGVTPDTSAGKDAATDAAASPQGAPEQYPYDPLAFAFKQKIPAGIADDPRSAAVVARLDQNSSEVKVSLSADGEVPPVYVVQPTDPFFDVQVPPGGQKTRFRVPAGAVPGGGADYPLVLLDPSHPDHGPFTELRLWQASVDRSQQTLSASGSGLFHYNNDGTILNPDKSASISVPFQGWGTGCGLSILAGLIRPDEVKQGTIAHALRFAYGSCNCTNTFRPPATKTDQPKGCSTVDPPSAMEMGMRLQLDKAVDCSTRTVPGKANASAETRFLRMICRALQDYGMIMVDGTQPKGLLLMMESKATASWSALVGAELWGSYSYIIRDQDTPSDGLQRGPQDGIPWHKLRVLSKSVFP